ncbi:MAG: PEP-CTERM sorting domain-containing protein [Phycisphaerae bacterium]|nr:PEP-CTERM sorting domain-containing protein [Phycisphaerae bacterium]
MSKQKLAVVMFIPAFVVSGAAFGWGGPTHAALTQRVFDDPTLAPFLSGIDQSAIENYIGEPGDYQNGQWSNVQARAYLDTGVSPNGINWNALDETTRLKYMTHNLADVAVPLGHSPANQVYTNTVAEAVLEAQVSTWTSYPSIAGTCNYTHSETGHTYNYTGTIDQILNTHYNAVLDNAAWFKSTKKWYGHSTDDNRHAGWNGTKQAMLLQRAMLVDYFLAKELPVMTANNYIAYSDQYVVFDQSSSYDPDAISWNSDGTYSQLYGVQNQGIEYFVWDVNGDVPYGGNWDYGAYGNWVAPTAQMLIDLGVPTDEWSVYYVAGVDNEGKVNYGAAYVYIASGPAPGGDPELTMLGDIDLSLLTLTPENSGCIPEPATISLLGIGAMVVLKRKR